MIPFTAACSGGMHTNLVFGWSFRPHPSAIHRWKMLAATPRLPREPAAVGEEWMGGGVSRDGNVYDPGCGSADWTSTPSDKPPAAISSLNRKTDVLF